MLDVFIDASYNHTTKMGAMGIHIKDRPNSSLSKCFVCIDSNKAEEYCFLYLVNSDIVKIEQIRVFTDNRHVYDKYKNVKFNNIFELIWIPRYLNSEADKLATQARKTIEPLLIEYNEYNLNCVNIINDVEKQHKENKKIKKQNEKQNLINNFRDFQIEYKSLLNSKLNELINNCEIHNLKESKKNTIIKVLQNKNFNLTNYDINHKIFFIKILKENNVLENGIYNKDDLLLNIFVNIFSIKNIQTLCENKNIKFNSLTKLVSFEEIKTILINLLKNKEKNE